MKIMRAKPRAEDPDSPFSQDIDVGVAGHLKKNKNLLYKES